MTDRVVICTRDSVSVRSAGPGTNAGSATGVRSDIHQNRHQMRQPPGQVADELHDAGPFHPVRLCRLCEWGQTDDRSRGETSRELARPKPRPVRSTHARRPTEIAQQIPSLFPGKGPELSECDVPSVEARVGLDAPSQIGAAPRAQAIAAREPPENS